MVIVQILALLVQEIGAGVGIKHSHQDAWIYNSVFGLWWYDKRGRDFRVRACLAF